MPTTENDNPLNSIPLALQSLFYKLQYNDTSVSTKELTKSFGWDTYDSFMQHDVQELNRVLCEKLEDKMKVDWLKFFYVVTMLILYNKNHQFSIGEVIMLVLLDQGTVVEGTIQQLFEGHHMNYIECVNVDYKSTRKESFYGNSINLSFTMKFFRLLPYCKSCSYFDFLVSDLQLDVKGCRDVYASFDKYVEVERLEGDNKYHAEDHGLQVIFLFYKHLTALVDVSLYLALYCLCLPVSVATRPSL